MTKFFYRLVLIAVLIVLGVTLYTATKKTTPLSKQIPRAENVTPTGTKEQDFPRTEVIASGLDTPWAIAFIPDKTMLVTERSGNVRVIDSAGRLDPKPITISQVKEVGEGGLLSITIDPNFEKNRFVYVYFTYKEGNKLYNKVVRYEYYVVSLMVACPDNLPKCNNAATPVLKESKTIVDKIPSSSNHNGGRIKFGPDNLLYITTGDAQNPSLAQDKNSLAGKILRIEKDGSISKYSYGHRNPQGITWDSRGQLWEVEHGQSATDELNVILQDKNYGWPTIHGDQKQSGMIPPRLHSGSDTWAPGGLAFYNNSLFFAGLRGQALYQVKLPDPNVRYMKQPNLTAVEHFKNEIGRIRDVIVGPDNMLYITTSNRDGRGSPKNEDDKIIRVNPSKL